MSISEQVLQTRKHAGLFDVSDSLGVIVVEGADHLSFLQALTSNEVMDLPVGAKRRQALCDKKSRILADFLLYRLEEHCLLITDRFQVSVILDFLETYHFAEEVTWKDERERWHLLALQGPEARGLLQSRLGVAADQTSWEWQKETCLTLDWSVTGDPGVLLLITALVGNAVMSQLCSKASPELMLCSQESLNILRIESGIPRYGVDMHARTLLLELGDWDCWVSFTKGCFPGQEVIARTKSRGQLQKRLMGISYEEPVDLKTGDELHHLGKKVGTVGSTCYSPALKTNIALVLLHRQIQADGQRRTFQVGEQKCEACVVRLPFYFPEYLQAKAVTLYDAGMKAYHTGNYVDAAMEFEKGLKQDPTNPDLYEALGQALERQGDLDAAIRLNLKFAELDANAVMAHANLSRLYMNKGLITEAEEEQAKAAALGLRLQAREYQDQSAKEKQEAGAKAEKARRLQIFQQVLELDPQDEMANFGMGRLLIEQKQYSEACKHLQTVIAYNDTYSAAYPLLGKGYLALKQMRQAREVLQQGIQVARNQGDLMPLREMENLLTQIGE